MIFNHSEGGWEGRKKSVPYMGVGVDFVLSSQEGAKNNEHKPIALIKRNGHTCFVSVI